MSARPENIVQQFRYSLQLRIALLSTAVMLAASLLVGISIMSWYSSGLRQGTDRLLQSDHKEIADIVYLDESGKIELFGFGNPATGIPESVSGFRFIISDRNNNVLFTSPRLEMSPELLGDIHAHGNQHPRDLLLHSEWVRVMSDRLNLDNGDRTGSVFIHTLRSIDPLKHQEQRLRNILLALLPLPLIAVGLGGWYVARRSIQPLDEIIGAANQIGANDLGARFPVRRNDELGRLARTFNKLFQRLEDSFKSMRRFTADASHELRTPLTAIRTRSEVTLAKSRTADEYQACLADIVEETEQLERMIDTLLLLARGDAELVTLSPETVDLTLITKSWIEHFIPLAEERNQVLVAELPGTLPITTDKSMIERILINLIDNAIEYAPTGSRIRLSAIQEGDQARIRICNESDLLSSSIGNRIFERFFRQPGRDSSHRHSGLGLSLVAWAVQSLRGSIRVQPDTGQVSPGVCFNVALPLHT